MKDIRQIQLLNFILIFLSFSLLIPLELFAQKEQRKILLIEIKSEINPPVNRYIKLALKQAEADEIKAVIIEMNTYGGALVDADEIRTALLEFPKPTIVFINKNAASAGALISIACDSIYMAPGSNIGAATVVTAEGTPAGGKMQSYMRSIMRSTAEANGRNPAIAEAMVDEDLASDSLKQAGKVLSLTTDEAIRLGYCEKKASNLNEAISFAGFGSYEKVKFELSTTDKVIAFFLNPFVSGLLILLIIGGIYFEFQNPGMIFPILIATISICLYFIPYYLNGLAANWEIILFFIGVLLLALEILVIPGFGLAGVTGIVLMLGSLVFAMLANDLFDFSLVKFEDIIVSTLSMFAGFGGGVILIIVLSYKFTTSNRFMTRVALPNVQDKTLGYVSTFNTESLVGQTGTAYTVLRPSGKILINGKIHDAYSRGEFIEKDSQIVVVSDEGTSLRVKRLES